MNAEGTEQSVWPHILGKSLVSCPARECASQHSPPVARFAEGHFCKVHLQYNQRMVWIQQEGENMDQNRQAARSTTQKSKPLAASLFVLITCPQLKYKQLEQRDCLNCPVQTLACDPHARRRQERESSNGHIPCCTQQSVPQHMVSSGLLFSLCLQVPFGAVKTIQLAGLVCSSYNTSCEQRPEL